MIKVGVHIDNTDHSKGLRVNYTIWQAIENSGSIGVVWFYPVNGTSAQLFASFIQSIQTESQTHLGFTPLPSEILLLNSPIRGDLA